MPRTATRSKANSGSSTSTSPKKGGKTASKQIPAEGFPTDALPTPSRFLTENGNFNFTPGLLTSMAANELNPFEASFQPPAANGIATSNENNDKPLDNNMMAYPSKASSNSSSGKSATGKRSKAVQSIGDTEDEDEDEDVRRQKFLEKNRAAATKCRQKKKEWITELEQKADEASRRNEELQSTIARMKEELMALKGKLLAHRDCNCHMIQKYIHSSGQFKYLVDGDK